MVQDKMTPTPWTEFRSGQNRIIISTIKTGDLLDDEDSPNAHANALAIVSAVNNTYGARIDPKAVPIMLAALKKLVGLEAWIGDRVMKEMFQATVYTAIEKANIK